MKKLMMMAIMVVASATAFAGDSDGLKAILKAKTYADALNLLNANLDQLVDAEEKAKAYNKLVDLAMAKVNAETKIIDENQIAVQLGQGQVAPFDTLGLADALCNALNHAITCDEYDRQPNAKGKIKMRFRKDNATRLWGPRTHLVNIGQDEAQKGNSAGVLKYWGTFLDTDGVELFAECDHTQEQAYIGQVAFFTAQYALQAEQYERAKTYCDMAMKDESQREKAFNLKLIVMKSTLKTQADSLKFVDDMKAIYADMPDNDVVLNNIFEMYGAMGQKDAQIKLLDEALARNPQNFTALANKGLMAMNENDAVTATEYLKKAKAIQPENAVVLTYIGICLNAQAANEMDDAKSKALFAEAIENFDKAKELDPTQQLVRWGYNRYQSYYNLYGADDPRTVDAELDK